MTRDRHFRSTLADPHGRGVELGRRFAGEIRETVAAYQRLFAAAGTPVDLATWGGLALPAIEQVSPSLLEEIHGIAEGAGLPVTDLAAINARTEVLAAVGSRTAHECSTVVKVRDGDAPVAVQAWDWYADLADLWFVWEIPHADGSVTTTVTEFGIVGKIGVSTRGLGLLFNILHHERDGRSATGEPWIGAPVHVLARAVLDQDPDLNRALVRLAQAPVSASSSLTLVASRGPDSAAVSVEVNPGGVGYALPDDRGLLVHTNHFLSDPARLHDTELREGPDTVVRLSSLRRRLGRDELTARDLLTAMDSHLLGGGDTCCHVDHGLAPGARFATLATVVLDIDAATLHAHPGGPCTHPLKENTVLDLKRIDNMDILTEDVDRLVDFYHGLLGLPFHLPYEKDEEWAAIDLGNLTLYLFKSEQGEHAPRRTAVNADNAPGFDSMAFEVADLDQAEAVLDGKVEWVDERIEWKHPNGTWYRYRPFFDPDGNMLYVTEPHQV